MNGDDWTELLKKDETREYSRHCDFCKLSIENWNELLQKYPEWYARCPNLENLSRKVTKEILVCEVFFLAPIEFDDVV